MQYILILEDDRTIGDLMAFIIYDYIHLNVIVFRKQSDALEHVKLHGVPKMALVDYYLEDGIAGMFLGSMKTHHPETPLLIVTAMSRKAVTPICERYGASFLSKPFDVDNFVDTIRSKC